MTTQTPVTTKMETWLRNWVRFLTNCWLRVWIRCERET